MTGLACPSAATICIGVGTENTTYGTTVTLQEIYS